MFGLQNNCLVTIASKTQMWGGLFNCHRKHPVAVFTLHAMALEDRVLQVRIRVKQGKANEEDKGRLLSLGSPLFSFAKEYTTWPLCKLTNADGLRQHGCMCIKMVCFKPELSSGRNSDRQHL